MNTDHTAQIMDDEDILVISIPYVVYYDMEESFEDNANGDDTERGDLMREALERFLSAKKFKAGRGISMQIVATRKLWEILREEIEYRWEINGGNGNPYGVENPSIYTAERRACKVALDRIDEALAAPNDGLQRIATTLHSLLSAKYTKENYMNFITVKSMIPGAAYEDMEESFAARAGGSGNPLVKEAYEAFLDASYRKRSRGYAFVITATVDQWKIILDELCYRLQMNGGGNPHGVEFPAQYASTRRAYKEAISRVEASLKSNDDCQRIATSLLSPK